MAENKILDSKIQLNLVTYMKLSKWHYDRTFNNQHYL